MKKIIAFLALGLIAQAHAEDIQIQMTGNIYANTCIIDNASRNLTVVAVSDSGSYQWHTFYPASEGTGLVYDAAAQRVLVGGKAKAAWSGDAGQPPLHAYANSEDVLILSLLDTGPTPRTLFLPFVKR